MVKGKYKKKLNAVFLLLFTLLIGIFMSVYVFLFLRQQSNEYESTIIHTSKTILNNSQIKFEAITSALDLISESEEMLNWASSDTPEIFYLGSIRIQDMLRKVSSKININFNISTTFLDQESLVVTPVSTETKEYYFTDTLGLSEEKIDEIYSHFRSKSSYMIFTIKADSDNPSICYVTKKQYGKREVLYFTTVEYSTFIDENTEHDWYLCNGNGVFAMKNNAKTSGTDMYKAFQSSKLVPEFQYGKQNVYTQSFFNINWTLLYAYENKSVDLGLIIFYFILPFNIMTLLAIFLSRYIANRLYRPMEDILEDFLIEDKEDRDVDEFKLIKENSSKIKSLNSKLKSAMNERNNLLIQRLNRDLLFGVAINRELYGENMLEEDDYCVAIIEFPANPFETLSDDHIFLHKNEIFAYTQDIQGIGYANINHYTCALIIRCDDIEKAKSSIYGMLESIELDSDDDIRIAISNIAHGVAHIKECYTEARKILDYKFLYNQIKILTMEQIRDLDKKNYYYPLLIENKLIHSAINGDINTINIFNQLIEENNTEVLSPGALKNLVFALVGTLSRIIQELKADSSNFLEKNEDFSNLSEQWNKKDIIAKLRAILNEILVYVNNSKVDNENSMAEKMLDYIHKNYSDDIMLIDLAEKMNISEKYCGILFKKTVGQNYKNYLNSYRIEKAKGILYSNNDMRISTLSKEVGFNSSNTFIRVFTKYTGMTPKVFAEQIKKETNC